MADDPTAKSPARVILADDHTMFREGLAMLLGSFGDVEVVGQSPKGREAVRLARQKKPEVVITQIEVPIERAKETFSEMLDLSPRPKIIVVTIFEEPRYVREFLDLGISAYVTKSASTEELVGAIRAAIAGPSAQNVIVTLSREALTRTERGHSGVLSERELEILLMAARGLSNRQLANALNLSEPTTSAPLA